MTIVCTRDGTIFDTYGRSWIDFRFHSIYGAHMQSNTTKLVADDSVNFDKRMIMPTCRIPLDENRTLVLTVDETNKTPFLETVALGIKWAKFAAELGITL